MSAIQVQSADQHFFARLEKNIFEIPKCKDCEKYHFFPRVICPHCGSDQLQWVIPSGNGTVYSTTTIRRTEGNYNVSLITLDEGPRLMSRVEEMLPDEVRIGQKVRARILQQETGPLLVFVLRGNDE